MPGSAFNDPIRRLVGRQQELGAVEAALDDVQAGGGRALFLIGEPGIGKSSLARAAARVAELRELPVLWGFAWESGGAPAYWPWTQVVGQLVERFSPEEPLLGVCGRLLGGGNDGDVELHADQARFQLMESVRALIAAVSRRSPLVIVLEDLHAADTDSLQLMHHVVRYLRTSPVLIIGTFRNVEARALAGGEPLWASLRDATALHLARLTESDVAELLRDDGNEPDPAIVRALLKTTAGNPLFVTELAGVLSRQEPGHGLDPSLPLSVQQVIDQQLERLEPATRSLLATAAVLGRQFVVESLAAIVGESEESITPRLETAMAADLLEPVAPRHLQFVHVLYRDALYHGLGPAQRQAVHSRRAEQLTVWMEQTGENRRAEIAMHLASSGESRRADAVLAWRDAARHAVSQLAFEEAGRLFQRAIDTFGEGPEFTAARRCGLLLELADGVLKKGDIESGQAHCREAFAIARSCDDTELMASAALTYGSVFVAAKVDRELIDMLEETRQRLAPDSVATRARVLARLAAARQPAPNPAEPMALAREAIELARSTGDERVLFDTLKSAISALLDFAPVEERRTLNLEVRALAEQFGSVPDQFRSNLRLIMDCIEHCDRTSADELVDACDGIAKRLGLPHYQWRVASARAMQHTIDGQFEDAVQAIESADTLARAAGDLSAKVTLPLQRLAVLYEWDGPGAPDFDLVEKQVSNAFRLVPDAQFYAQPLYASFVYRQGRKQDGRSLLDPHLVDRFFAGMDRFCMCRLGEVAALEGSLELAERVLNALLPYKDCYSSFGIMGMACGGPVAWSLGVMAEALGRPDDAREYYELALDRATRMRATPIVARCLQSLAGVHEATGNRDIARKYAEQAATIRRVLHLRADRSGFFGSTETSPAGSHGVERFSMAREGDVWKVEFDGAAAILRNAKGLAMLARLVAKPEAEIHVLDLAGDGKGHVDAGETGPGLDPQARNEYQSRLQELADELSDAESMGDIGRAEAAREERDFITRELSRAFGLGGRQRPGGSAAERARVNVRRRIKTAIERIDAQLPGAGRYLESTVKTGSYCRYAPT